MVEEGHREVVLDEVLGRAAQVHRVPVEEGLPQLVQLVLRYLSAGVFFTEEDVAPEIEGEVLGSYSEVSWEGAVDAALEHVRDGIVGEVYGAVGERLDEVLLIEG